LSLLQREDRLQQIVKLVGPDVLPNTQRLILFVCELLKDGFLTQSAFDDKDMYCAPQRQVALLRMMLALHRRGDALIHAGAPLAKLQSLPCVPVLMRAKSSIGNDEEDRLVELERQLDRELAELEKAYGTPAVG
jgi:V/A-type H+-transporting ATPase subunit A